MLTDAGFQSALEQRRDDILGACTSCGKCFEACPITEPAGIEDAEPKAVVNGILDLLRSGEGPDAAKTWSQSCILSGECIKACDYGVNPRFMLSLARAARAQAETSPGDIRRKGVRAFSSMSRSVKVLSRLQLPADMLARLGQLEEPAKEEAGAVPSHPDFVFYTGCNILKTPHIALLSLDILDALGVSYKVVGGPTYCCGIQYKNAGDTQLSGRMGLHTQEKFNDAKTPDMISWCASCHSQLTEFTQPTFEKATGEQSFNITPYLLFLEKQAGRFEPLLKHRINRKIALHRHPGIPGVMEAAEHLLSMVPGVEIVDLNQPAVGLMSNYVGALPDYRRQLHLAELEAARDAEIDALVAVYHADHRELCAHEGAWPFEILNILDVLGAAMGLGHEDHYKRLKAMQDVDAILADCADMIAQHDLDPAEARVVIEDMLNDQPLPLLPDSHAAG